MYYNTRYLTSTVSAVFEYNVSLTDVFAFSGTPFSCTSLSTLFLASPAARALLNLSLYFTCNSTFNTLAQLAAPSSCAHSSSLSLFLCRYKPQHRGTEVTLYKNNKHCTSAWYGFRGGGCWTQNGCSTGTRDGWVTCTYFG